MLNETAIITIDNYLHGEPMVKSPAGAAEVGEKVVNKAATHDLTCSYALSQADKQLLFLRSRDLGANFTVYYSVLVSRFRVLKTMLCITS